MVLATRLVFVTLLLLAAAGAAAEQQEELRCKECGLFLLSRSEAKSFSGYPYCASCYQVVFERAQQEAREQVEQSKKPCGSCAKEIVTAREKYFYVGASGAGAYYCSVECRDRDWSCARCGKALAGATAPMGEGRFSVHSLDGRRVCKSCYDAAGGGAAAPWPAPAAAADPEPAAPPAPAAAEPAPAGGPSLGVFAIIGATVLAVGGLIVLGRKLGS